MKAKERIINETIQNGYPVDCIKLKGICIIPQRKLHDSGYRMMTIVAYDKNYKYYMVSNCSDVVDFTNWYSKIPIKDIHMDINKHGIINVWSNKNTFSISGRQLSTVMIDTIE